MSVQAAKPRFGVEPVSCGSLDVEPPFCPHGPTLVFERYYADRESRKFFACALHRDRKGCPFFHWVDEPFSPDKRKRWMEEYRRSNLKLDRAALTESLEALRSLSEPKRVFCTTCSQLLPSSAVSPNHTPHQLSYGVDDTMLAQPSHLLTPLDNKKSSAQFLFSEASCQLLVAELRRLEVAGVLCVGTPRLHEAVQSQLTPSVNSLLLDVDIRYYNMFNGHFYDEEHGERLCQDFLKSGEVAMVIDPPFGGLVEILARQIRCLWEMAGRELSTVLVLPYFMEQHVSSVLPSLRMCDYQVSYENHKHFSSSKKSQKPSPVRLFTNIPSPGPRLPLSEGYHLCRLCQRYVAPNNAHCPFCDSCTSKDGRQYRHCGECGVCVKPARQHCSSCGSCQLPTHFCGDRVALGCHICGSAEHKRRDCPQKTQRGASSAVASSPGQRRRRKKRGREVDGAKHSTSKKKLNSVYC